jgi:TetR/AcrR family transcriptional regulator, regulator of biofilm formation and stress response
LVRSVAEGWTDVQRTEYCVIMAIRPATHRARGQARRVQLLQAAVEVIAEQGVGGASHRAIATRAGMPLSTTSYFFASLDDLMAAALAVVADRVATRLDESIRTIVRTNLTAEEAIDYFIDTLLGSPSEDVAAQFEIYLECARRPQLQAAAHQIMVSVERAAESALRVLGIATPGDRAQLVVAMIDGLALHRRAWPRGDADRRALSNAIHTVVAGFRALDALPDGTTAP